MYSKPNGTRKTYWKFLSGLIAVLVFSVFVMPGTSHAFFASWDTIKAALTSVPRLCSPGQAMFEDIAKDQPQQSIIRFGYNYDTVRYFKIFYNIFGVSPDNAVRCMISGMWPLEAICGAATGAPTPDCSRFLLGYSGDPTQSGKFALGNGNGSLLGVYYTLDSTMRSVGNPLNLSYFAQESFNKVPFLGKALAAGDYKAPLLNDVYFAWRIVRNLAFGVFALLMLVVGVMMINRTRLSAQTVVTIQYALPKIVIAIILVAFSYPIGAIITTATYYMAGAILSLINTLAWANFSAELKAIYIGPTGHLNIGVLASQIVMSIGAFIGFGPIAFIIILILVVLMFVQFIIITIKMVTYYIKMVLEVVLSPISFVYSAIPGNDEALMGWFKKMLAYALSFCALWALPDLVMAMALNVSVAMAPTSLGEFIFSMLAGGVIFQALVAAMITYVGLSMVLKLPAQIEETLTGKKKGK